MLRRAMQAAAGLLPLAVAAWTHHAAAQMPPRTDQPVLFQADELVYEREAGRVIAIGNVEVSQEDRILLADRIIYEQANNLMSASGNVTLVEPTGEVLFADHMELTEDLRDGIIRDLRVVLANNAKFAANGARRSGGDVLEMSKVVYSPCNLCPDDPTAPPIWQLKAVEVVHDRRDKIIEYTDAWLEVAGVPVFYTPYLSHPDPTVRRKSGIVDPKVGASSDLGFVAQASYFFDIAPNIDATLTPIYTSRQGPVMAAEYRHLFTEGEVEAEGSITRDSADDIRGHVRVNARHHVNRTWRTGLDVDRASDDTYLRRYNFGDAPSLTTRVFAEGFRQRNYMAVSGYTFQGLRQNDDPEKTPIISPLFDYHHLGSVDPLGGRTELKANLLVLSRVDGTDSRRLSVKGGWNRPFQGAIGDLYTASFSVRGDLYDVSDVPRRNAPRFDGVIGRIHPEASLEWRWPLIRRETPSIHQLIEPMAKISVSPNADNAEEIPNEDSLDFEFDDTNLFRNNRFSGLDRVEGGQKVSYGLRWGIYGDGGGQSSFFVGQSYRLHSDDTFARGSGLEDNFSDIVARVDLSPGEYMDLLYRTRVDKENLDAKRHELQFTAGTDALRGSVGFLSLDAQTDSQFSSRREVNYNVSAQLSRYWRVSGSGINDVGDNGGLRSLGLDLTYEDECLVFTTSLNRTFFEDRDVTPTDSILFRFNFKTLGEVESPIQ